MERPTRSKRKLKPRKLPTECLCCGEENPWVINKVEFVAPFRDTEHSFRAEAHQCRHCDAISTTTEQVEAISATLRDVHKAWISQKFKNACKELGVSIRDLVDLTDIPFATLGRASSGESLIEATVEKLLWMQIEKLSHERRIIRLIQMEQSRFSGKDSFVTVKADPKSVGIYARILKTAAQSPLGNSHEFHEEGCFSNESYKNLVIA